VERIPQNSTAKKGAFLAAYARTASITKAAKIAKVDRTSHYDWKASDPDYLTAFEAAKELAIETLEDEAIRRAHEGLRKPVYQGGKRVGYVQEYSDTLLIFLLKAARPEKYRERISAEHTGPNGAILNPPTLQVTFVTPPALPDSDASEE
jgi:hypothetical protein